MIDVPDNPVPESGTPTRPAMGCLVAFLGLIAWVIVITLVQAFFSFFTNSDIYRGSAIESTVEFIFTLLICVLIWKVVIRRCDLDAVGLKPNKRSAVDWTLGLVYGLAGSGVAIGIIYIAYGIKFEIVSPSDTLDVASIGPSGWLPAAILFIFAAGEEEIVGRGFLYPLIKRSSGFLWAVVLSSVVFSTLHLMNPSFSLVSALDIFLAGIFLALLRELTGDLFLAWGAHFGWNIGLVAAGFPVSGFVVRLSPWGLHAISNGPVWLTGGSFGPEGGLAGISADMVMIIIAMLILARTRSETRA
jgi:membrane protease YdiL (CAAX protease family)